MVVTDTKSRIQVKNFMIPWFLFGCIKQKWLSSYIKGEEYGAITKYYDNFLNKKSITVYTGTANKSLSSSQSQRICT